MSDDPGIPSGWTYETAAREPRYATISCPGIGGVTLDLEDRLFRGGWTFSGRPASTKRYVGRGWKKAMIADAVAWLQGTIP